MSNRFCPNCGNSLETNARFCGNCGAKIEDELNNVTTNQNEIVDIKSANNTTIATRAENEQIISNSNNINRQNINVQVIRQSIFSSKGRINRLPYFLYSLGVGVVCFFAVGICFTGILAIIGIPLVMACCVANIMLIIQRCHDLNKSGWFYFVLVIPVIGIIFALYLLFAKGTEGPNQYGPDPLQY